MRSPRKDRPNARFHGRVAESGRPCEEPGCDQPGDCPAPKAPNSRERWYFCPKHAEEYNRNWDYFAGLSAEEAAKRAEDEQKSASGYAEHAFYGWGGPGDGRWSRDELHAFETLELDSDADFEAIKTAWRRLAKANHPDVRPNDAEAAVRFQAVQAAFEILRRAEERRPR